MKVATSFEELERYLRPRWFAPERRLLRQVLRYRQSGNKKRYLRALIKKLNRKGVILTPDLIEYLWKTVDKSFR